MDSEPSSINWFDDSWKPPGSFAHQGFMAVKLYGASPDYFSPSSVIQSWAWNNNCVKKWLMLKCITNFSSIGIVSSCTNRKVRSLTLDLLGKVGTVFNKGTEGETVREEIYRCVNCNNAFTCHSEYSTYNPLCMQYVLPNLFLCCVSSILYFCGFHSVNYKAKFVVLL